MRVLAIDPGSNKTGLAWFEGSKLKWIKTLEADALTPLARRLSISAQLVSFIKAADVVISEEPCLQGRANNGMQRLLGVIEFIAGQTIQMIHPMTVKKIIAKGMREKIDLALAAGELLSTNKEKDLVADAIVKEAWDETDAVAIGLTYVLKEKLLDERQ